MCVVTVVAGALAIGQLWLALVWEGILVGLTAMLCGVAAMAARLGDRGVNLAPHITSARSVAPGRLSAVPFRPPDPDRPVERRPARRQSLVQEIEAYLRSQPPSEA